MEVEVAFSPEVLALFVRLLNNLTLSVGAPDFDEVARVVSLAKAELAAATQEKPSSP